MRDTETTKTYLQPKNKTRKIGTDKAHSRIALMNHSPCYLLLFLALILVPGSQGFLPGTSQNRILSQRSSNDLAVSLQEQQQRQQQNDGAKKKGPKKKKKVFTLAELQKEMTQNPAKFERQLQQQQQQLPSNKKKKSRRSRKRVENPKQKYVYASQRRAMERKVQQNFASVAVAEEDGMDEIHSTALSLEEMATDAARDQLAQAKEFGLQPTAQHVDPAIDDNAMPKILGKIRVGDYDDDESAATAGSYAYLIQKPAGWSILGSNNSGPSAAAKKKNAKSKGQKKESINGGIQQIEVVNDDGSVDVLEYNEMDVLSLMTPEELEEEGLQLPNAMETSDTEEYDNDAATKYKKQIKVTDDDGTEDTLEYSELDVLALLTPEELEEYAQEEGIEALPPSMKKRIMASTSHSQSSDASKFVQPVHDPTQDPKTAANLKRIQARLAAASNQKTAATFAPDASRPSIVAWLKETKKSEGTPIRGGKYWTAWAGATNVDDSGLVLICPKAMTDNVFVDFTEYVAVVGNGGYLAPKSKIKDDTNKAAIDPDTLEIEVSAKLRKGRAEDNVQTVTFGIPDVPSTCTSVVEPCQTQFQQGIRGDPAASPLDRRAQRRLIHCNAMTVSSLICDDSAQVETDELPDDITVLTERRTNSLKKDYSKGSFVGRSGLRQNSMTNAYREINGAADGFPGWFVDRYGDWLFVQHDPSQPRGPLPSIHDGNTAGVYYLEANPDRSSMGSETEIRPRLLEGKAAPDELSVVENGVTYIVSLNKDLSTGMFLDQRPNRAWLTRNCCEDTRVLNCFAHTGAFSVAAASAGASTVSLDLSKKWLDRLPAQLEANGVAFDERQDCIHGDCFDWLARLAKRGEKYDIVIVDPPSTSVGGRKKKRWSIRNDMDELVALAAQLVKKGGLLWTTTNSASIHPIKFARLCRKGLENAGIPNAKLERIQPMPADFPTIGPQPVKNLVWRIPM